ncbi:SpoIIIAH-like family protein, partial [Clostridioides difficile]
MKFNYKGRGFVIITLTAMLVVVGTVNYQLSKKSLLETSKEFKAYEEAQLQKNTDDSDSSKTEDSSNVDKQGGKESADIDIVDSKASKVKEKATETSKEIKAQLSSEKNMKKASYILDMKMNREKQRNELVQDLNEMINNPSTTEESRKEASNMKLNIVKTQEKELQIENLLSTKGYEEALVY